MATVKKYPNVLTGAFTASQNRVGLAVPCRGALMVVARLKSGTNESGQTAAFVLGNTVAGTFFSHPGQGFILRGTMPGTLQDAGGQTVALYCGDSTTGLAVIPFFLDFVKPSITAPAGGLASTFTCDLEVWYEEDADQMLLNQLNASTYTPV